MLSAFLDLQRFILITVVVDVLCGLLLLFMVRVIGRQTKTLRPAFHLRLLALWLIFASLLLYMLQFVFSALTVYCLCVLFGMVVIYLYSRYAIEKNDFLQPNSLGESIIHWITLDVYCFIILPLAIANILFTLTSLDAFFVTILAYSVPISWSLLNVLIIWLYGKRKRWDMVPFFAIEKSKPRAVQKKTF